MSTSETLVQREVDAILRGAPPLRPGDVIQTDDGPVTVSADDVEAAHARALEVASRGE